MVVDKANGVSKAPPPTALKSGNRVRVAQDANHIAGQNWQYGIVRHVYNKLLLDINYDSLEQSKGIPAYEHEVQLAL